MSSEEKKTQTEINNFRDLRFAYLHSKFGTHNSLQVPNQKVILNEDFVEFHNVVRIPEQIKHLNIYWINKGIAGEICVPGQWNYAYVDGKFYHMVKMHSQGFIEGVEEEGHMYNLIYDDWQNDWMNNTFYLKGTIELTGDPELVRENIHQTSPMFENMNGFRFLNGVRKNAENDYKTVVRYPTIIPLDMRISGMSTRDKVTINNELKKFHERKDKEPNEERLNIPFLYKVGIPGNWKGAIINGLDRHRERGFQVFDVATNSVEDGNANFRVLLENMLGTTELYTMSSHENRVFTFAKTLNPTKGVPEIDLSGCTDIIVLDRLYLTPLYGVENRIPTFRIEDFVNGVIQKQGGPSNYKDEMIQIFEDTVVPPLAPIVSYDEPLENKIFRNITLEKIDRDIVHTKDPRGAYKNPEGKEWTETRLGTGKHHKNHIGDNTRGIIKYVTGFTSRGFGFRPNMIGTIKSSYRNGIEDKASDLSLYFDFNITGNYISKLNALVYLPDEYKLVAEEGNNDDLDFSRNLNELYDWFALIPDYDRKTHTLAYKVKHNYNDYARGELIFDPKNPIHADRKIDGVNLAIQPVIFDEILSEDEQITTINGEKPSTDFLRNGLNHGMGYEQSTSSYESRSRASTQRAAGAYGLRFGTAFFALTNNKYSLDDTNENKSHYLIRRKIGQAKSKDSNYSKGTQGGGGREDSVYGSTVSYAQFPESVYDDEKREGRKFITEFSFPVKTDGFSIIDTLRKYDDIPDNFLRWEIINSKIKKGTIKKYMRTITKSSSGRFIADRHTKEDEAKIPANTIVMIWLTQRMSGSPNGDRDFDREAYNKYKTDHPNENLNARVANLIAELNNLFFNKRGEFSGEFGAIPIRIRNESKVYPNMYPKDGGENGRSQLSLSYGKPHKGMGFVAGTRFLAPLMTESLRFTHEGYLNYDKQGTDDGIMATIPNPYKGEYPSDAYNPRFTMREKVSDSISTNTFLGFLTNNYITSIDNNYPDKYTNSLDNYGQTVLKEMLGGNYEAEQGDGADYLYNRFRGGFYNGDTLTLRDWVKNAKTFKTNRLDNPITIPPRGRSSNDAIGKPPIAKPRGQRDTEPVVRKRRNANVVQDILTGIKPRPEDVTVPNLLKGSFQILGQGLKRADEEFSKLINKPLISTPGQQVDPDIPPAKREGHFTPFNEEVPPFIIKYMTLTDDECILKHGDRNNSITNKEDRLALFKEKLVSMVRYILNMLESGNTFIKFEGTNGYASIKLNTKEGYPKGDYELFTNEKATFKTKDDEKWNFINHIEKDVDVLINTRNELSIHGNKLPFKSRKYSEEPELDLGLHVKALDDVTQTEIAVWYAVTMDFNEQDVFQTFIEVPKTMTKQSNYSPFEREQLIRKIGLRGEEYLYNKNMIEYQKVENKFTNQYEQDYNNLQRKYGIARGVMKIIGGAADTAVGGAGAFTAFSSIQIPKGMPTTVYSSGNDDSYEVNSGYEKPGGRFRNALKRPGVEEGIIPKSPYFNRFRYQTGTPSGVDNRRMAHYGLQQTSGAVGGLGGIIDGALSIGEALESYTIKEEYRKQKFANAEKKLSAQGDILNRNYEFDRKNMLDDLWAMSANVIFPQINANIVYKLYNKHFGLNDIHMIQYYPKGKLLQYIKNYYREFGYNILVRDFECTGVESIINHLRYQYIKEINHPNISITEMIQARALAGIKVIPWTQ